MNLRYNLMVRNPLAMCAALLILVMTAFWVWPVDPGITAENGLLESGQDAFLIMACLFHGYHSKHTQAILDRYLRSGLMLVCFGILLREFDIDNIGESSIWESVETLTRAATVIAFMVYMVFTLKKIGLFWKIKKAVFTSPTLLLTLLGCIIYIFGWPFDKMMFPIAPDLSVFIEETLELSATLLLFLSSTLSPNAEAPAPLPLTSTARNHSL